MSLLLSLPLSSLKSLPSSVSSSPRRWWTRAALWAGAALVVAALLSPLQTRAPYVDGQFYLSSLHSLYVDGDVDLRNEAEFFPWLVFYSAKVAPPPNGLNNPFPIGPALMWAPFYFAYDVFDRATGGAGIDADTGPVHGPVYFGTVFWVVIGLLLLADTLARLGARPRERRTLPLIVFALSPLPAYVLYAPDMGHGCAFASAALLLSTSLWAHRRSLPWNIEWAVCGLALGIAFTVRWQDVLLGLVPLALLIFSPSDSRPPPGKPRGLAWLAAGAFVGALPQLVYWKSLYGVWLTIPQGAGFLSPAHAEPLAFFFSTWNGLVLVHPGLGLGLAGLFLIGAGGAAVATGNTPGLRAGALAAVLLQLLTCMWVMDWWAGGAFGQRRVISLLPLLAVGLYALFQRLSGEGMRHSRLAVVFVVILLAAWNGLGLVRLYDGSIPYNPSDRSWYANDRVYDRYDWRRRFGDTLFGQPHDPLQHENGQGTRSEGGNTKKR